MVFAELPGGVPLVLEDARDGDEFVRHTDRRTRETDFRQAGAVGALSRDERRPPRRARLLAVGIGEHHAFLGDPVDVRRLGSHQAMAVAAQVGDADVVTPDDQDVRYLRLAAATLRRGRLLRCLACTWHGHFSGTCVGVGDGARRVTDGSNRVSQSFFMLRTWNPYGEAALWDPPFFTAET